MAVQPGSHIRNPRRDLVSTSVSSWLNFTPMSLTPQLWLDASDATTITESGGFVSQWNDKSGNGFNYSQGTGVSQPLIVIDPISGLQTLDFDGSNNFLRRAIATSLGQNVTGLTIYAAVKPDVFNINRPVFMFTRNGSTTATRANISAGAVSSAGFGAGGRTADGDNFRSVSGAGRTAGTFFSQCAVFDYANTDLFLFVNGQFDVADTSFQTQTTTSNTASDASGIGANFNGSSPFDGKIGEILVYHQAHDTNTRLTVTNYLHRKWGVVA